ncbi:MAG: BMP family ABC transporter substrate-binding protein [Eubacteriales bacterium]
MKKLLALLLAATMVFSMAACSSSTEEAATTTTATTETSATEEAAPAEEAAPTTEADSSSAVDTAATVDAEADYSDFKIGAILVHDENSGYDLAHIEGILQAVEALGLDASQVTFKYNIAEDEACYDAAADLADAGCDIIFSDSYGHQTYMQQAAIEFPDITFVACTGDTAAFSGLSNLKNMFPYTYESRYVSGVVAGMKLAELMESGEVTDPYIGYVGAYPYAEVVSGYTAFFLGVQSIVPEAHMDVQYTNSWFDLTAEGEAANALISRGCVIIGQHADSTGAPSAVQAALENGTVAYSVGYNIDMQSAAPDAALTSAQNVWGVLYTTSMGLAMLGEEIPTDLAMGRSYGATTISELSPSCAEGTAEVVEVVWAAIEDGSFNVFDTSTYTVGGETPTSALALDTDGDWVTDTGEAIENGVFYESVWRSAPYFEMRIDGITELNG